MGGSSPESLKVNYNVDKEHEEEIELYTIISGRIQEDFISLLNNYDISDPNSEKG